MPKYPIKLYGKNGSSKPDCTLFMEANTIEKAAVKAAQELEKVEFIVGYKEVWNAKIKNPEDPKSEDYVILKNSVWKINTKTGELKTGKKISSLEGKLNQNARHQ